MLLFNYIANNDADIILYFSHFVFVKPVFEYVCNHDILLVVVYAFV